MAKNKTDFKTNSAENNDTTDTVDTTDSSAELKDENITDTTKIEDEPISTEADDIKDSSQEESKNDLVPEVPKSLDVLKSEHLSYEEINAILENREISQEDSIEAILEKAPTKLKMIISRLLDYQTKMSKKASVGLNDEKGKANNLNLFNTLKLVLKIEDNYEFNITFKVVNLIFIINKEDAYSELSLCRFDAGSKKSIQLDTFGLLATTIARLAEISNRTKENINFNVFKSEKYDITSSEVEKLQQFYTM